MADGSEIMGGVRRGGSTGRRERGASLVEFALVLPLFVMLVLGMFSGGIALNDKQQMTHAVREGARYGSTIPASEFTGNDMATAIRNEVVSRSDGLLDAGDVCVSIVRGTPSPAAGQLGFTVVSTTKSGGQACDPTETYPNPKPVGDTGQRVQVSASHETQIELGLFGSFGITMDTEATAKSEWDT